MGEPLLWRYRTAHGDDAVTDRWQDIPLGQRAQARPFDATVAQSVALDKTPTIAAVHFDPLSFGAGALIGAALATMFARSRRSMMAIAVVATVVVVGTAAYLGFVRREAGLSAAAFTSPREMIGEVHSAAGAMQEHFGQQQKTLEQIDAAAK